jgi:hypothetical protein
VATGMITAALFLCTPATRASAQGMYSTVITDVSSWRHPVKDVFRKHKVLLRKVELLRNKKYPVFYVDLPYDPQTSASRSFYHQLYLELLEANGPWDYALQSDHDHIRIEIRWDKENEVISEDIVSVK